MKSNSNVSNTPLDFMSSMLGSDLGASLLSEEEEEEEEEKEDKKYAVVSKNLCSYDYTSGHSMDNFDGSGLCSKYISIQTFSNSFLQEKIS